MSSLQSVNFQRSSPVLEGAFFRCAAPLRIKVISSQLVPFRSSLKRETETPVVSNKLIELHQFFKLGSDNSNECPVSKTFCPSL